MPQIDVQEFVSQMGGVLHEVARMAVREQSSAIPLRKRDDQEDGIEHEAGWQSRVGIFSSVDLEIQEFILDFAYSQWPFLSVLVEEKTKTIPKFEADSAYCLLVDPVDGTKNYLAGRPEFCHTISLMENESMLVSMLYSHAKAKLFASIAGQGTRVLPDGSSSVRVELVEPEERNVLLCHVSRIPPGLMEDLQALGYEVRSSSQNATDIVSMVDGKTLGFISLWPIVYDVWSPAMIIQEAGGWLSDWLGTPLRFEKKSRVPHTFVSTSAKQARRILPVLGRHLRDSSVP